MTSTTNMSDLSNPFPGLRCFLAEEDYLFFGRQEQIEDLLRRLRTNRLVAVVGTSGSGKSSLVRAGLLPAVLGGGMSQAGSAWEIAVMRPGGRPLAHLAHALCDAGLYDADAEDAQFHLLATLNRSRNGLVEAVRQSRIAAGSKLLLVVDQFEELFRFNRASAAGQEESIQFVNLLLQATQQSDQNVYVVLTMRSDFLGECSQFLGLAEAVNDGEFLIPRMTRDQIQEAIEGPIRVRGAEIAPRLLFRLLNDVEDNQDQLPVLQHALMRTWELWGKAEAGAQRLEAGGQRTGDRDRRTETGDQASGLGPPASGLRPLSSASGSPPRLLDLEHYEATGGMHQALSLHADEIFDAFPSDAHRTAAARLFKVLTERGADGRGIRRPTRLGNLVAIAGVEAPIVRQVIEAYRVPGVTFLMPPVTSALDDTTVIDISHESLMRVWSRLRGWVEEEAQSARIYRRLHETAALHSEKRAGLYHDPDLQIALSWREAAQPNSAWAEQYNGGFDVAMRFLDTSHEAAEREDREREAARQRELERARQFAEAQAKVARLFKRFAGSLAAGLVLAVALTVWAFKLREEAKRQEAAAQQQRQLAQAKEREATQSEARAMTAKTTADRIAYSTQMLLAQSLWDSGNLNQLRAVLAETGSYPDRGFEWYYWQRLCQLDLLTFRGHTKNVLSVAFSPDGRQVASGSDDATVNIWEAETGRVVCTLKGHLGAVNCLAFSPDGRRIATSAADKTVKVWDTKTGRLVTDFRAAQNEILTLAFSTDGRSVGTGSSGGDGMARVWDAETGRGLIEPIYYSKSGPGEGVGRLAFSPDFRRLAVGLRNGNIRVLDLEKGRELFTTRRVPSASSTWDWVNSITYSPDGRRIACGGSAADLCVWDAESGALVQAIEEAHQPGWTPVVVAFSPDGRHIATGASDNIIKIRETESGREWLSLRGHSRGVTCIAFSLDGRRLVSASRDLTAKVWDLDPNRETLTLSGHSKNVSTVSFSADGKRFFSTDQEGTGIVWETDTARVLNTWKLPSSFIAPGAIFPDGRRVALAQNDYSQGDQGGHIVVVFDVETGRSVSTFTGHKEFGDRGAGIDCVAVSPDGRRIASTGWGSVVKVWEAETGRELTSINGPGSRIMGIAFSPDGRRIAAADQPGVAVIWDADTGRQLQVFDAHVRYCIGLAFSPDGRQVAVTCSDSFTRVFDSESGRQLLTLQGHSGEVKGVAFSPDGRRIATCADNTIKLWDVESGRELLNLKNRRSGVPGLAFSPDGQRIVSGTFHGVLEVWRTASSSEVSRRLQEEREAQETLEKRAAALERELEPFHKAAAPEVKAAEEARGRELAVLAGTTPKPALSHQPLARELPVRQGDPGVVRQWLVLAPIPFDGAADLNVLKEQVPNEARLRPRPGERPAPAPAGLAWTAIRLGEDSYHLNFAALASKASPDSNNRQKVAYAVAYIISEAPQSGLTLLVGSDDTARIYLNEREIYRQLSPSEPWVGDRDEVAGIEFKAGINVLVFKVANADGRWGGSVRFLDAAGQPVKGIRVTLDPDGKE